MKRREIIRQLNEKGIQHDPAAPKETLLALLNAAPQNRISKLFNYAGARGKIHVTFNAAKEDEPAEIMICEEIGKDPWSGEGIGVKDVQAALNEITPKTRALNFFTNSPGGDVNEGKAIRATLDRWQGKITNTIIGIAASTASWCIPADETRAYKSSQMFLHRSWGMIVGNADDLRNGISFLETTDGQIAEMLADQSNGTTEEMLALMKAETLLTGQGAKDLGLVDTLIDGEAKNQFPQEWITAAKQKIAALNSLRTTPAPSGDTEKLKKENQMKEKIALLNKRGITPPANATEPQLDSLIAASDAMRTQNSTILAAWNVTIPQDATDAQIVALVQNGPKTGTGNVVTLNQDDRALLDNLKNQVADQRRTEIRNRLNHLASADGGQRVPVNEIEAWEKEAIAAKDGTDGNPILNRLEKLPSYAPGVSPVSDKVELVGEAFKDIQGFVLRNGPHFQRNFVGNKVNGKLDDHTRKDIGARAVIVANTVAKHKKMLVEMFNSNVIDSDLQRQVIMQDYLEAYALQLISLEAFSVKYDNVPLQGTDTVVVPYFPLQTNASVQFVKGTGYTTANDWTENSRKVTVGGDGDAATSGANATAGTAKDRLYQRIDVNSYDMARQPYLIVSKLVQQAAAKLAVDVISQIYSRVIVTGNFGAAVKTVAPALFTPDDVADLEQIASTAEWPDVGRSLVLTNTYKTPLLKDPTFKSALAYGSTDPIRKAMIQEAYGFENMFFIPNLAAKMSANAAGWINHKSAVLCAFAPIMPAPGVRALLSAYEVYVDPRSGAVLEYRKQANATTDTEQEIMQSCFGADKGVGAALKIIKGAV